MSTVMDQEIVRSAVAQVIAKNVTVKGVRLARIVVLVTTVVAMAGAQTVVAPEREVDLE